MRISTQNIMEGPNDVMRFIFLEAVSADGSIEGVQRASDIAKKGWADIQMTVDGQPVNDLGTILHMIDNQLEMHIKRKAEELNREKVEGMLSKMDDIMDEFREKLDQEGLLARWS